MSSAAHWDTLSTKAKVFASSLVDSGFLLVWVVMQWGVKWLVGKLALSGFDALVLQVFQVVFAISTLVPIIVYIVQDAARLIIRAKRTIRQEMLSQNNER